ncbi:LysR family transcriptional regulator [Nocardia sp. NEAU-G5]|uniref:LysR family transcriptional regulator n=1 Tax=Nocardia albiluteola TaxID=2842303 RepID=A0ABS6B7T1_9NOCA|nr:LysR family transcriptional regulator [Nocardia albiluteola]MBU3065425.1 LysR family transcriptional regulator [Nocardia albiluteola]
MEIRQLRFFVTVAEELHFGRAAAREHIVQSALSQQIQRLERELGVALLERTTHYVRLTPAGDVMLSETRRILHNLDHAVAATRAATVAAELRVAVGDASFDTMPLILDAVRDHLPALIEIHHVEAGVPEQYRLLAEGRLDIGIGRAAHAPNGIASQIVRLDPMGVLVGDGHRLGDRDAVAVADLADTALLFADETRAPEYNQFVRDLCLLSGFIPTVFPGTVQSMMCARILLRERRCALCVPRSCTPIPGLRWLPLIEPATCYPWSLLWRASDDSEALHWVLCCAKSVSTKCGWMSPPTTPPEAGVAPGIPAVSLR